MEDEAGPLFRASKRRKVVRKKADDQEGDSEVQVRVSPAADSQSEKISDSQVPQEDHISTTQANLTRPHKLKKQGIAFNSLSSRPRNSNDEKSIVLAEARIPELVQQSNERFVKPTGKAVVADDKHMSAFIDSKLAELRSAGGSIINQSSTGSEQFSSNQLESRYQAGSGGRSDGQPLQLGNGPSAQVNNPGTVDRANTTSKSTYTRPTRRRPPPARPEADVARDSMIDQIMREAQVPHYDQATTSRTAQPSGPGEDEDIDRDAAAAAAFKADFLAAAQERNYHRRAPVNPTQGPKLGGSRSARERMKAMEEAQKGPGKTGKP